MVEKSLVGVEQDLIDEVILFQAVFEKRGLQLFRYQCEDDFIMRPGCLPTSPLFYCATPDGTAMARPDGQLCGCLVEIKYPQYPTGPRVAWTDEWTEGIRADDRIPWSLAVLTPDQLWAFAEWQQVFREYFGSRGLRDDRQNQAV